MQGPETRRSLLVQIQDTSQQAAWQEFVTIYEPLVYRLARGKGIQHADAEDLVQDVFAAVQGAIERFDPESGKGSFRGWLFRISRNLMINFLTRQKEPQGSGDTRMLQLLHEHAAEDTESATLFDLEYRREVFTWAANQAREYFTDDTWQAFWRTGVEGESSEKVAADLRKTPGAIRVARCRVLAKLKEYVQHMDPQSLSAKG
ncbi:sigma-70 family RNA polymerase sigma factor [Bremerella cremea]|uniref:Sigma-70 family RNA polymerase sigma factor n=1 Tax=Blastopirellula marina TaxID=124 RepID=A0A2S8FVV8_9BACT|nr:MULTISPECIES: sigma-70 family RNA polymerase sigma factor [Pirellulaceae]PQO36293.1 sigma-70 family RNA polymerase sigma factor [Blastopirellula marina]RCS48970.1 sigma-70 family RNA polymerase sigma factor [Bremerella cremea]